MLVIEKQKKLLNLFVPVIAIALILKLIGYLYFHIYVELFTIVLSIMVFYSVLKEGKSRQGAFFVLIGVGFMAVGVMDILHSLSYKGMGIFNVEEVNVATQFWILARLIQAFTFLIAIIYSGSSIALIPIIAGYSVLIAVSVLLVFSGVFPDALLPERGLTLFKIYSEYFVISLLLFALVNIYRLRDNFEFSDHITLSAAIGLTIISEYCFTLYYDVYGIVNFIGHMFKVMSYILVTTVFFKTLRKKLLWADNE